MCKELLTAVHGGQLPKVAELFKLVERIFDYDMTSLFLRGPQSVLDETTHCQPAVVLASLAALEAWRERTPEVSSLCKVVGQLNSAWKISFIISME